MLNKDDKKMLLQKINYNKENVDNFNISKNIFNQSIKC